MIVAFHKAKKTRGKKGRGTPTARQIEALNRRIETAVRVSLTDGIARFKDNISSEQLAAAFASKNYKAISEHVDIKSLSKNLQPSFGLMAATAAQTMSHTIPTVAQQDNPKLRMGADNPHVKEALDVRHTQLMQDMTQPVHEKVKQLTQDALGSGRSPKSLAEELKQSIGLNDRQQGALDKYRDKLWGDGHTESDINDMAGDYADRLLQQRADMIAITEVRNASAEGQFASWQEMLSQGLIPENSTRVWVLGAESACPQICRPMDGVAVGLDEPWVLPNGDEVMVVTASHPCCRCSSALILGDDSDASDAQTDEADQQDETEDNNDA
jgi:hypothetical protein